MPCVPVRVNRDGGTAHVPHFRAYGTPPSLPPTIAEACVRPGWSAAGRAGDRYRGHQVRKQPGAFCRSSRSSELAVVPFTRRLNVVTMHVGPVIQGTQRNEQRSA